jgi:uncharacterized protein YndB with AHSA1/START domain
MTDHRPPRRVKKEIEISAAPEAIWKALTDAEELARWFPLSAKVTPGAGGKILLSWGPGCEGEARIDAWEPGRRLRTVEGQAGSEEPKGSIIEWSIEKRGGKTLVRLVQSSFAGGTDWDDEYYGSSDYGWGFMLVNLRHYLERHAGTPRQVAWPRRAVAVTREEAYERLVAPGGLFREGARGLIAGSEYMLEAATGENYEGTVEFVRPPRGFCVSIRQLNDALLWLTIEGGPGQHEVQLWLSAYNLPQAKVAAFEKDWAHVLERVFA